jgi:hypothetical protein
MFTWDEIVQDIQNGLAEEQFKAKYAEAGWMLGDVLKATLWIKRRQVFFFEQSTVQNEKGRPPSIGPAEAAFLHRILLIEPSRCQYRDQWTVSKLCDCLKRWNDLVVSEDTMRRWLKVAGYYYRKVYSGEVVASDGQYPELPESTHTWGRVSTGLSLSGLPPEVMAIIEPIITRVEELLKADIAKINQTEPKRQLSGNPYWGDLKLGASPPPPQ